MIYSNNRNPSFYDFQNLMARTDAKLNDEAQKEPNYFKKRGGKLLEKDVFDILNLCARDTPFMGSIQLVSGARFPDIVAGKYFGVEVKSTEKDHWISIGSSILESTRISDIKNIFLTFGKLGGKVAFLSKPYEECLSDIAVTHYPRYQINMCLASGETIFDKIGIAYDSLRTMKNPVKPVAAFYRSKLKPGESLWWADDDNFESTITPATVKMWAALSSAQKRELTILGYALFPEVIQETGSKKYQQYALWLATQCGVINTNIRDQFSAGGKIQLIPFGWLPAVYGRLVKYRDQIIKKIWETEEGVLKHTWGIPYILKDRIKQWCSLVLQHINKEEDFTLIQEFLAQTFLTI